MDLEIIVSVAALVLAILAILLPFLRDRLKQPELEIYPQEEKPRKSDDCWYYHIEVWNKKRQFMGTLIQRDIVQQCRAKIEFLDKKSRKPIIHQTTIKWAQQPNPMDPQVVGNRISKIFDPTRVPTCQTVDVGFEKKTFDVAIKFRGGKEYYAVNPWIHFKDPKNPGLKLDIDECIIKVELTAANLPRPKIAHFLLLNKGTELEDLKIIPMN